MSWVTTDAGAYQFGGRAIGALQPIPLNVNFKVGMRGQDLGAKFNMKMDVQSPVLGSLQVVLFYNPDPAMSVCVSSYDLDPGTADSIRLGFVDPDTGEFYTGVVVLSAAGQQHEAGGILFSGLPGHHLVALGSDAAAGFSSTVVVSGGIQGS